MRNSRNMVSVSFVARHPMVLCLCSPESLCRRDRRHHRHKVVVCSRRSGIGDGRLRRRTMSSRSGPASSAGGSGDSTASQTPARGAMTGWQAGRQAGRRRRKSTSERGRRDSAASQGRRERQAAKRDEGRRVQTERQATSKGSHCIERDNDDIQAHWQLQTPGELNAGARGSTQ